MEPGFLSDIEMYYSPTPLRDNLISIEGDEVHHLKDVMRHGIGDEIFVTDGCGNIFKTKVQSLSKKIIHCAIKEKNSYTNKFSNITFGIPRLKNNDRFEFALEKCVELGITNFIVFESRHTIAKGDKTEKWQKFLISAMKQSLRAWLPSIGYVNSLEKLNNGNGEIIMFEQNAETLFSNFLKTIQQNTGNKYLFLFGPEGGFSNDELVLIDKNNKVRLTENRLRSESAIITAAALLSAF